MLYQHMADYQLSDRYEHYSVTRYLLTPYLLHGAECFLRS